MIRSGVFDCATNQATDYSGNYSLEQAEDYPPVQENILRNQMEYDLPLVFEPLVRNIIIRNMVLMPLEDMGVLMGYLSVIIRQPEGYFKHLKTIKSLQKNQ